jgi:hypothetical protein
MPHVEKLADFLVLPPILSLTIPGTINGGLAYRAVEIRRCLGFAGGAPPAGHDCCWIGVRVCGTMQCSVMDANRSRIVREKRIVAYRPLFYESTEDRAKLEIQIFWSLDKHFSQIQVDVTSI